MEVGFCFFLMFLFVPETFWDRTPRPRSKSRRTALANISKIFSHDSHHEPQDEKQAVYTGGDGSLDMRKLATGNSASAAEIGRATIAERRMQKHTHHVGFADQAEASRDDVQIEGETAPAPSGESKALHLTSMPIIGKAALDLCHLRAMSMPPGLNQKVKDPRLRLYITSILLSM